MINFTQLQRFCLIAKKDKLILICLTKSLSSDLVSLGKNVWEN